MSVLDASSIDTYLLKDNVKSTPDTTPAQNHPEYIQSLVREIQECISHSTQHSNEPQNSSEVKLEDQGVDISKVLLKYCDLVEKDGCLKQIYLDYGYNSTEQKFKKSVNPIVFLSQLVDKYSLPKQNGVQYSPLRLNGSQNFKYCGRESSQNTHLSSLKKNNPSLQSSNSNNLQSQKASLMEVEDVMIKKEVLSNADQESIKNHINEQKRPQEPPDRKPSLNALSPNFSPLNLDNIIRMEGNIDLSIYANNGDFQGVKDEFTKIYYQNNIDYFSKATDLGLEENSMFLSKRDGAEFYGWSHDDDDERSVLNTPHKSIQEKTELQRISEDLVNSNRRKINLPSSMHLSPLSMGFSPQIAPGPGSNFKPLPFKNVNNSNAADFISKKRAPFQKNTPNTKTINTIQQAGVNSATFTPTQVIINSSSIQNKKKEVPPIEAFSIHSFGEKSTTPSMADIGRSIPTKSQSFGCTNGFPKNLNSSVPFVENHNRSEMNQSTNILLASPNNSSPSFKAKSPSDQKRTSMSSFYKIDSRIKVDPEDAELLFSERKRKRPEKRNSFQNGMEQDFYSEDMDEDSFKTPNKFEERTSIKKYKSYSLSDTPRSSRGLRVLSVRVREIVFEKKQTTYKEVADDLIKELALKGRIETRQNIKQKSSSSSSDINKDEKNVRRRVYDALNVLIAAGVIKKSGKSVFYDGTTKFQLEKSKQNTEFILKQIEHLQSQIKLKHEVLFQKKKEMTETYYKLIAMKNVMKRNQNNFSITTGEDPERINFPFIILSTIDRPDNSIVIRVNDEKTNVHIGFKDPITSILGDLDTLLQLDFHKGNNWELLEEYNNSEFSHLLLQEGNECNEQEGS